MNETLIRRWINDLRYGGHEQAKHFLRVNDGYCCLGRAIEVLYGEDVWVVDRNESPKHTGKCIYRPNVKMDYSPVSLEAYEIVLLGLTYEMANRLTAMNDHGSPFKDIADYLEAQLEAEVGSPEWT